MADKEHVENVKADGEDLEKLKEEYEEARKKYNLPSFEEIDKEFELRKLESGGFIIKDVRRIIVNKLQSFADWLTPILNPHPESLHSAIETKIFEKQEISDMLAFYKRLGHLIHMSLIASLKTEQDEINFIKDILLEYPEMKIKILGYVEKIAEGWARNEEDKNYRSEYSS